MRQSDEYRHAMNSLKIMAREIPDKSVIKIGHYTVVRKAIEERDELKRIMKREEDSLIQELNDLAEGVKTDILTDERGDRIQDKLKRIGEINEYLRAIRNAPSNYMTDNDGKGERT